MTGLILFAHGSTVASANEAVQDVALEVARRTGRIVEAAFLECAEPTLPQAVTKLAQAGARRVVVLPYFLTMGIHLRRDLPGIVEQLRPIYEGVAIEIAPPLDGHPALLEILIDRYREATQGEQA